MVAVMPYTSDAEIEAIGRGLLDRSLPKPGWTHAAHFAAALWIISRRTDLVAEQAMPGIIRAYNEATGVANTDSGGYHETITSASLMAARGFLRAYPPAPLFAVCNALMQSRLKDPDWPLAYWSRKTLFSPQARRAWVSPDLAPLPFGQASSRLLTELEVTADFVTQEGHGQSPWPSELT